MKDMKYSFVKISLLILFGFLHKGQSLQAQEIVKHPVSVASTTAEFFTWDYVISKSEKKVIEYFIVLDDSGHIKTAFNACDVCYAAHKGYSQVGDKMKCNNCGNQYAINKLGTAGSGGCWPGYLPNTIENDSICIKAEDLITGEYYFLLVAGIENEGIARLKIFQSSGQVLIRSDSPGKMNIMLFGKDAKVYASVETHSSSYVLNHAGLEPGLYFLRIEKNGKSTTRKVLLIN